MTRRLLLALPFALPLLADPAKDAWDALSDAAGALSEGDAPGFLSYFNPQMPGYEKLRADATALVRQAEPRSSIDLVANDGDDRTRRIQADWQLTLASPNDPLSSARRQDRVEIQVAKTGKKWRIESFKPEGFFAPTWGGPSGPR